MFNVIETTSESADFNVSIKRNGTLYGIALLKGE